MSCFGFDEDSSPLVPRKFMLAKEVSSIRGGGGWNHFLTPISLPLFDEDVFQALMRGSEVSSGINILASNTASNGVNTTPLTPMRRLKSLNFLGKRMKLLSKERRV